jgi:hypothetical protein
MKTFSRVVKNSPPPISIRWSGDQIVVVDGQLVLLEKYKAHIHSTMTTLQNLINNDILCAISLPDLGISTKISPDPSADNQAPYYGPFSHGMSKWLDNPDSDLFAKAMISQKMFGLEVKQSTTGLSKFTGNIEQIWEWLATIEEAWKLLYCLYHTTSGLPG